MRILLCFLIAIGLHGEIIDRIALTVGSRVITESMLVQQIRLAAFYDNKEPDLSPNSKRLAAETLISQTLLVQEMDDTRYPEPAMTDVLEYANEMIMPRFSTPDAYRQELVKRRLEEADVRRFLQMMVRSVQFLELRFRRGQQISSEEIAAYYGKEFKGQWAKTNPNKAVPPLDEVSEEIEETLLASKTDAASEEWVKQVRATADVRFREEVFQ